MSSPVLVVDDSRVSRMMISAIIRDIHPEWTIVEAANGSEAISKAGEYQSIKLMILDYNMPDMDGLSLAQNLRTNHPESFISLLTANIQKTTQEKASELGVFFAAKPVTQERVEEIVLAMNRT